ncbi:MAG: aminoacyl-tRNA hydrolase [Bacteroidetes bacterium]|nr:MAG: aminoacyl-tRNA hydrolase [Bacteroidota bacterium]
MSFLIVGLGNPGPKYAETRHNIGFKVLDAFAEKREASFELQRHAELATTRFKGKKVTLIKPTTYMNLSGKAVNYWMQAEKIPLNQVLVITDDIALPFGTLRLKGKGSSGGHNGLKDIEAVLGTQQYARLRFGVGADFARGKQVDYVLGEWSSEEQETLEERIQTATEFIKSFVGVGLNLTMTNWNNR